MSLEKRKVLGHIEVQADGVIFVKELNQILEDGVVISGAPHRTPLIPGQEHNFEYPMLLDAIKVHWTTEVIEAFKKSQEQVK